MTFDITPFGEWQDDAIPLADISRDEKPGVVADDIARRARPQAHIIAFANEKGGVGKSTLAFNVSLALTHMGHRVLAVDCDRRQQTLQGLLNARDGTARTLGMDLPRPAHIALMQQNAAQLLQEIARAGQAADFIVIDLAGQDSPLLRRVVALADTMVTPVNCSHADLGVLGRLSPVDRHFTGAGPFGQTVWELRAARAARGLPRLDWIVAKNRVRRNERRLIAAVDQDLATLAGQLDFRTVEGLVERVAYRELLPFGLTYMDLKLLPDFGAARAEQVQELTSLVAGLRLPHRFTETARSDLCTRPAPVAPVTSQCVDRYRHALATVRITETAAS